MTAFIDLNAPDNSGGCPKYKKLWQSVLIQALKDGVETKASALHVYMGWAKTIDCVEVCDNANIDHGIVTKLLKEAFESEEKRIKYKNNIYFIGKRPKKIKKIKSDLFNYFDLMVD